MTAHYYITVLKKGFLLSAVADKYQDGERKEWAFETIDHLLLFLATELRGDHS